jgi:hypothetical protein
LALDRARSKQSVGKALMAGSTSMILFSAAEIISNGEMSPAFSLWTASEAVNLINSSLISDLVPKHPYHNRIK